MKLLLSSTYFINFKCFFFKTNKLAILNLWGRRNTIEHSPVCVKINDFDAEHSGVEKEMARLVEYAVAMAKLVSFFKFPFYSHSPAELHISQLLFGLLKFHKCLYKKILNLFEESVLKTSYKRQIILVVM